MQYLLPKLLRSGWTVPTPVLEVAIIQTSAVQAYQTESGKRVLSKDINPNLLKQYTKSGHIDYSSMEKDLRH